MPLFTRLKISSTVKPSSELSPIKKPQKPAKNSNSASMSAPSSKMPILNIRPKLKEAGK
jgi:hypothetical protein